MNLKEKYREILAEARAQCKHESEVAGYLAMKLVRAQTDLDLHIHRMEAVLNQIKKEREDEAYEWKPVFSRNPRKNKRKSHE